MMRRIGTVLLCGSLSAGCASLQKKAAPAAKATSTEESPRNLQRMERNSSAAFEAQQDLLPSRLSYQFALAVVKALAVFPNKPLMCADMSRSIVRILNKFKAEKMESAVEGCSDKCSTFRLPDGSKVSLVSEAKQEQENIRIGLAHVLINLPLEDIDHVPGQFVGDIATPCVIPIQ